MSSTHLAHEAANRVRATGGRELQLPLAFAQLSNGRYKVQLCSSGSGVSCCDTLAVSRGTAGDELDPNGFHVYLRDVADGFVWSAGYQPTRVVPQRYEFRRERNVAEIIRADGDIECSLSVCVAPQHDLEIRCCRLTNHSHRQRRIELTSYVEFVLCDPNFDAGHPAFSKLFVETRWLPDEHAILARRRPRSSDEQEIWGFHRLLGDPADEIQGGVEFETNRAPFIGRGRTLAHPLALESSARLGGDYGPVLDPIGCLRMVVSLDPGQSRSLALVLGVATSRSEAETAATELSDLSQAQAIFDLVASTSDGNGQPEPSAVLSAPSGGTERLIVHSAHPLTKMNIANQPARPGAPLPFVPPSTGIADQTPGFTRGLERLDFDNGIGGFTADGQEYVIRLCPDKVGDLQLPPQPWTNVIANEWAGCLVTERGGGYTWVGNSRHNRLTPWSNDPVCDTHAEAFWVRDEEAGAFWSPAPGPTPAAGDYEVRHGFGYTTFRHESHELAQETTVFMAAGEPLKLTRLRLVNRSDRPRQLSVFSYVRWALGTMPTDSADSVNTAYDEQLRAILARNPRRDCRADHVAFSAAVSDAPHQVAWISHTADGRVFIGPLGDLAAPAAIATQERLNNRTESGLEPCAAWQLSVQIGPNESFECTFLLGETVDDVSAAELIRRYREPARAARALDEVAAAWRNTLSAVEIETPNRELDLLVNGWLVYQNLSCRLWGRSAYYQSGGAFGFRDQLQDAAALVYHRPDLTRGQILRHAAQQFPEGDVFHWWHADTGDGLRTRFSDDLLWLPFVAAEYVSATGDDGVLDEVVPFVTARPLADGEQEAFLRGERADATATVYEHCCLALDRGLTTGSHGLPLIGCGDWNDGMNRIGRLGRGESVWLGFFIVYLIDRMLPFCRRRGDSRRADRYVAYRDRLVDSLNTAGWDGDWYRRAYYDDGSPIGSAENEECRIDALAQAWAVLSGVAPAVRAERAVRAVEQWLVDDDAGLIRLLTPPFDRTRHDPGYIKGYLPGIRENGGQYTHGVLWFIRAVAGLGRGTRAVELLRMLSPISHTATANGVATYQTEPYVVAADVYGEAPHVGRGGWTWYTGSAGWMWRVAVESIMGLSVDQGRTLVLKPTISSQWPHCRLSYRLPDGNTKYEITIENPAGKETGVTLATVDGQHAQVANGAALVPIERDGRCHQVVIRL